MWLTETKCSTSGASETLGNASGGVVREQRRRRLRFTRAFWVYSSERVVVVRLLLP